MSQLLSRRAFFSRSAAGLATPALIAGGASVPFAAHAEKGAAAPVGDIQKFKVGEIEVIALSDGYLTVPAQLLMGYEEAGAKSAAMTAYKPFDPAQFSLAVNGYIIKVGERVIAVDSGAPGFMAPNLGQWAGSLALAGLSVDQIDTLFLTHMHIDHVGGMSDISGDAPKALLPNAQLIASEAEFGFTFSDETVAQAPEAMREGILASQALVSPYVDTAERLKADAETEIAPGVTAVPLPGHTPGHMGLRITSGGESLLIWGDIVHAQAYQFTHPEWTIAFDADPATASKTRAKLLDELTVDRLRIAGMHLDFPSLGYVERAGDQYRYIPTPADHV